MNNNSITQLARMLRDSQTGAQIARENNNYAKPTYGRITDVNDPEERGRVKLVIMKSTQRFTLSKGGKMMAKPQ